jgi:hypothetical protein
VIVLGGENRADYEQLLNGLRKDSQPQGQLEEVLVEKLAMILWRHRRLLVSEGGEIMMKNQLLRAENGKNLQQEVSKIGWASTSQEDSTNGHGRFWDVTDLKRLDECLDLLERLREQIKDDGFDPKLDQPILKAIYGSAKVVGKSAPLQASYASWSEQFADAQDPTLRKKGPSAETCRENMIREIDEELQRLRKIREQQEATESKLKRTEILRQRIPQAPELERVLRYEASLERAFDRTLAQLERLQRMRLGQPVPPQLDVNVKV